MKNKNIWKAIDRAEVALKTKYRNAISRVVARETNTDLVKTILIKPVGNFCNLRCTYCYEGEHQKKSTLEISSIGKLYLSLAKRNETIIKLAWHGGEPLLAGLDYYKAVFEMQKTMLGNKKVSNTIQTSGYLINQNWIDLFKYYNVHVGISLDGRKDNHDKYRITSTGEGTFNRIVDSIKLMNENNINFGVITLIGDENPIELLSLSDEFSIRNIDIHPKNSTGLNDISDKTSTSPKELQNYLIKLFDLWVESESSVVISVFEEFYRHYVGLSPAICHFNGRCSNILAIDSNGDVLPCTRPFSRQFKKLGNIEELQYDLQKVETSEVYTEFINQDMESRKNLKKCKWYSMCNNGCPQHRERNDIQDVSGFDKYCHCSNGMSGGYFNLWDHMEAVTNSVKMNE